MPHIECYRPYNPQPVKARLAEAGVTQSEVCRRYGFSLPHLNSVVNGRLTPSRRFFDALSETLDVAEPTELFELLLLMSTRWYPAFYAEQLRAQGGGRDE